MGRRKRRNLVIGWGPRWLWTYTVGRGSIRMPLGSYLIFVAAILVLSSLPTAIPAAWEMARGIVTDIAREVSLLFQ